MNKIIPIAIDDIIADAQACSAMLTHACVRSRHWRITGGGLHAGAFLALAEEAAPDAPFMNYRFAPLSPPDLDEITAAVTARYAAGFSTLAFFPAADAIWGLFASPGRPEA